MLLTGYRKEMFRPTCNPNFQSVHCYAYLEDDIQEVLPYLNTVLGASDYAADPPSVMFQIHGRLIALYPRKIAINALTDEAEPPKDGGGFLIPPVFMAQRTFIQFFLIKSPPWQKLIHV